MHKAPCKYFSICGGCTLQDIQEHGEHKLVSLKAALSGLKFEGTLHPLFQVSQRSRRRANFKVNNFHLSFNKQKSRELVEIDDCLLLEDCLNALIHPINQLLRKFKIKVTALNMTSSDTGVELLFYGEEKSNLEADQLLVLFAKEHNLAKIAWQTKMQSPYAIVEYRKVELRFGQVHVDLPINSFLQVSKESSDLMAKIICENIDKTAKILELYCGCGSFTIPMSYISPITAVEGSDEAVKALSDAVKRHNLRIKVSKRDIYLNSFSKYELDDFIQIVINPPRNGATPQFTQIANSTKIRKVIMVSCSVENFIRDSRVLLGGGFKLTDLYPIDQFLYSNHLELIGVFVR